jgi:hypothetical protein
MTRREILRYITAEGSTRAEQIQQLLNIKDIEDIRRAMVKVENEAEKGFQSARQMVVQAEAAVCSTTKLEKYDSAQVLQIINQKRAIFGKEPIPELKYDQLKKNLTLPAAALGGQSINTTLVTNDLDVLRGILDKEYQAKNRQYDHHLRQLVDSVRKDSKRLRDSSLIQLLTLGSSLIDDVGACPLCDTAWEPGKLKTYIDDRLTKAQSTQELIAQIEGHASALASRASITQESLRRVMAVYRNLDQKAELAILESWGNGLAMILDALATPISKYPVSKLDPDQVAGLLAPGELNSILERILKVIREKYPEATPEQTAWDLLTRLEENLKALELANENLGKSGLFFKRASTLKDVYEQARNDVLGKLYNDIRDRFVGLYRSLHNEDEKEFNAILEPDGAALKLEVDFYGRGAYPPHALHSEGHQDSMGLCLYLALAERLTGGILDLIILDDVVMSVDAEHRRQLCRLLAKEFQHRQFLITTHDKTWATQLKTDGVARSKDVVEFYNWKVESGPQVNCESDLWTQIAGDLEKGDVSSAAAHLRRGSEEHLSYVCDALRAPVVYKLDGRWELGDLLPGAMSRYKDLLKLAKVSANSWNNKEAVAKYCESDSVAGQIFARTNAEQWAINPNVHYNNWANFSPQDFQPVVEAFQDLFGLFCCNQCGSLLLVEMRGATPGSVRCNCGQVNWNLIEKKDTPPK